MTEPFDQEDDDPKTRKKKTGSEDGDADAGSGLSRLLTTKRLQEVSGEHRHYVGDSLIDVLVEFCSAGLMRASAQAGLVWNKTFALVTDLLMYFKNDLPARANALPRAVARDQKNPHVQKKPGNNLGMALGPNGPTE